MAQIIAPQVTASDTPLELFPDQVYALGGTVPHEGRISWLPEGAHEFVALNCYLITDGDAAVLLDTSLPIVGDAVLQQIAAAEKERLALVLSRPVEFDCMGNGELITDQLPVERVYSQLEYNPQEWLPFRRQEPGPKLPVRYESVVYDKDTTLEFAPVRELPLVNAKLKLLACAWTFDPATGTLFTSDSFSHTTVPDPHTRIITTENDLTTEDDVFRHFLRKFDWLAGAETRPVREFVDSIFSRFDVKCIAPNLGGILMGADVVEHHHKMVDGALARLAEEETQWLAA